MIVADRLVLSWSDIDAACASLCQRVAHLGARLIIPVLRGGMVPACILSYATGIPVRPLPVEGFPGGAGMLIVDDVCDTGATFAGLLPLFPKASLAALYAKPAGLGRLSGRIIHTGIFDQDTWITFPWSPDDYRDRL